VKFPFYYRFEGKSSPGLQSNRNSALQKEIDIKYVFKLCRKPLHHKTQQKRALESGTKKNLKEFSERRAGKIITLQSVVGAPNFCLHPLGRFDDEVCNHESLR
jgi:hypothetical protein